MFGAWNMFITKVIVGGSLAYATYIVVTCPCVPKVISCHTGTFWGLLGVASTFILLQEIGDSGQAYYSQLFAESIKNKLVNTAV